MRRTDAPRGTLTDASGAAHTVGTPTAPVQLPGTCPILDITAISGPGNLLGTPQVRPPRSPARGPAPVRGQCPGNSCGMSMASAMAA